MLSNIFGHALPDVFGMSFKFCRNLMLILLMFFAFYFFENLLFETIIAGVFAACVLHETFPFSKVFSVVIFLPQISIWPCLFVAELIE